MGSIWIKEFTGGLDARRLPETSPGGTLIRAVDGHITRGGEFEQRARFVRYADLPAGATKGLAATATGLFVFGEAAGVISREGGQRSDAERRAAFERQQLRTARRRTGA